MHWHLMCSPEFFALTSGRKSARKIFRQATELVNLICHELVGNSSSPPFAFFSCPFHMCISLPLGTSLIGVFWNTHGCEKPKSKSGASANVVYL